MSNNQEPQVAPQTQEVVGQPEQDSHVQTTDSISARPEDDNERGSHHDGDDSSNSESNSDSSTSTETPGTISTPRSSAHESGQPVPDSESSRLENSNPEQPSSQVGLAPDSQATISDPDAESSVEPASIPPVPTNTDVPIIDHTPSWVLYEEDTSAPDEEELKEIEADGHELNASDPNAIEKDVFSDLDDREYRPSKKIRLSWVIKGVRGTKERPNRARIMQSPSVCIDGKYWSIKFFPRGNKSRTSLSAYLRCSPQEPPAAADDLVGSFKAWEAAPDDDLSKTEPVCDLKLELAEVKEEHATTTEHEPESVPQGRQRRDSHDDDDESVSGAEDDQPETASTTTPVQDYRISAQLGLVMYNPTEPRTSYTSSASHQFYPHQDDWGWDTAVNHWSEIHRRRRGQRQALLRDDTIAVDAYVRIYDDPTKALFWHSSAGESQWDAKGLTGIFPVGTRLLYHSPATAGIIAWTLLAPFRSFVQNFDAGIWRIDSSARPRPLMAHLQLMLFQMRNMKKEELYVRLDNIIHEITKCGESFDNVNMFWEAFRRSMEIEAEGDHKVVQGLIDVFGSQDQLRAIPLLPVHNVADLQASANEAFEKAHFKGPLPNFLPLTLQRQSFDATKREWLLHNDRVRINEELDLSKFADVDDAKYTLYGFTVHDGDRTSGKFFSVLRPHGPGGKWLVFSDGNGNKVFSYTKKRLAEYEGLEGAELKKATINHQTVHTALYIRTSCLSDYLLSELETYRLPYWLKFHLDEAYNNNADMFEKPDEPEHGDSTPIELFWDKSVGGQQGKLDLYRLKSHEKAKQKQYWQRFLAHKRATIADIKAKIAEMLQVDEKAFKLWAMNHHRLGGMSKGYMYVLPADSEVRSCLNTSLHLSLWFTMLPGKYEVAEDELAERFMKLGEINIQAPPEPEPTPEEPVITPEIAEPQESESHNPNVEPAGSSSASETAAAADAEQASVREAVDAHLETTAASEVVFASTTNQPDHEQPGTNGTRETQATSNEEPATQSLQTHDNEQADELAPLENATTGRASVENDTASSQTENNVAVIVPVSQSLVETLPAESHPRLVETVRDHSPSTPDAPVTPSEPASIEAAQENAMREMLDVAEANESIPPVVHGHLIDASAHTSTIADSANNETILGHGLPPLPAGIPIPIGDDQIVLIQPAQGDISAEDAALISQMIAADLEAAERSEQPSNDSNAIEEAESDGEDEAVDSRPATPKQRIPDVYGFLHIFDAEQQKFTAHSTFTVPRDTNISTMVRKQMNYDDEKSFHLWKREGTYRTVGVSLESTFQDASLLDCCEVIVGDHLGETKMEALKAEAKFVDPGQLVRYLAMVQRRHPVAALTTQESVEIAEFGGDYYKGPLVQGQRHGTACSLITQAGDTYEGPLVAGQKSGQKGKMTYQNGDTYNGGWLDDMKHGEGEFLEQRTGNRYVGGYENDKRWGKGITYWQQADQQAALCQICYFEEVDALFYKCGHVVACYACAKQCAGDSNGCPVCRKPIEAVVKMYRS